MKNKEFAELLEEAADLLEIKNIQWKPQAYRKAARVIQSLSEDIEKIYKERGKSGLDDIPSIGPGITAHIIEFLQKGKVQKFLELKQSVPKDLSKMINIPSLGPKRVAKLYKNLHIQTIKQLETAAKNGQIAKLEGFGKKLQEEIKDGIQIVSQEINQTPIGIALPIAERLKELLMPYVKKIEIAGSIRRMNETVHDIDLLITSKKTNKVIEVFTNLPEVTKVVNAGSTKASVRLKQGINCDLRVVPSKSFGAALVYFTGSKDHNIKLRQIAIKQGKKLSEYGLFKNNKYIVGKTEKEVYTNLRLPYFPPEIRENNGEFNLKIPRLIALRDIKGDCHMHTTWSDGLNSSEEMIKAATKHNYEYIAITDHSRSLKIANGLSIDRLRTLNKELCRLQKKYSIRILHGAEVDILSNGKLDYPSSLLKGLDFVIGSIHSSFKDSKKVITDRIVNAIDSGDVHCIGHLTGRLINIRNPYNLDFDDILDHAKKNNVALEINSQPSRLDLRAEHIREAIKNNVKLIINSDSHNIHQLEFIKYGIGQARKGWAKKIDVLNTLPLKKFDHFLKHN